MQREAQIRTEMPPAQPTRTISAGGMVLSLHESEFLKQLGDCLRTMRALRSMSRRELASRSGVSERYIAQIESGRGNVSIVLLLKITRAIHATSSPYPSSTVPTGSRSSLLNVFRGPV